MTSSPWREKSRCNSFICLMPSLHGPQLECQKSSSTSRPLRSRRSSHGWPDTSLRAKSSTWLGRSITHDGTGVLRRSVTGGIAVVSVVGNGMVGTGGSSLSGGGGSAGTGDGSGASGSFFGGDDGTVILRSGRAGGRGGASTDGTAMRGIVSVFGA